MGRTIGRVKIKKPKVQQMPKFNPYQSGHGVHEDKVNKRSYRKSEERKEISEAGY